MTTTTTTTTTTTAFEWQPIDEETYYDRFNAIWPACGLRRSDMFLLGEPMDHDGDPANPGRTPRYLAHMKDAEGYWVGSRNLTVREFLRIDRRPLATK